jgi:hypothetical protein
MKVVYEIMEHGDISQFICRCDERVDFKSEIAKAIDMAFVKDIDVCIGPSTNTAISRNALSDHAIITAASRTALEKIRCHLARDLGWTLAGDLRKAGARPAGLKSSPA